MYNTTYKFLILWMTIIITLRSERAFSDTDIQQTPDDNNDQSQIIQQSPEHESIIQNNNNTGPTMDIPNKNSAPVINEIDLMKKDYIANCKIRTRAIYRYYMDKLFEKRKDLYGVARVGIVVKPNGKITYVKILHSSGNKEYDQVMLAIGARTGPFQPFSEQLKAHFSEIEVPQLYGHVPRAVETLPTNDRMFMPVDPTTKNWLPR